MRGAAPACLYACRTCLSRTALPRWRLYASALPAAPLQPRITASAHTTTLQPCCSLPVRALPAVLQRYLAPGCGSGLVLSLVLMVSLYGRNM